MLKSTSRDVLIAQYLVKFNVVCLCLFCNLSVHQINAYLCVEVLYSSVLWRVYSDVFMYINVFSQSEMQMNLYRMCS